MQPATLLVFLLFLTCTESHAGWLFGPKASDKAKVTVTMSKAHCDGALYPIAITNGSKYPVNKISFRPFGRSSGRSTLHDLTRGMGLDVDFIIKPGGVRTICADFDMTELDPGPVTFSVEIDSVTFQDGSETETLY